MRDDLTEIVRILDEADRMFKELKEVRKEARGLWDSGIEKLAGALWLYERGETGDEQPAIPNELKGNAP